MKEAMLNPVSGKVEEIIASTGDIYQMFPDYAARENTNLISTNNGTWTANRDGYVICYVQDSGGTSYIYINNTVVQTLAAGIAKQNRDVYQVRKGDVVRLGSDYFLFCQCYFIPPVFKAVAKNVRALQAVNNLLTVGPPDYANQEAVNRISTNGGTWTADRDGYCFISFNSSNTGGRTSQVTTVNGVNVELRAAYVVGSNFVNIFYIKVRKGDIIKMEVTEGTVNALACRYTPPVINPPTLIEEQPLLDYSTAEQDTGRKWVDGKTIYQKTYSYNLPLDPGGIVTFPYNSSVVIDPSLASYMLIKAENVVRNLSTGAGEFSYDVTTVIASNTTNKAFSRIYNHSTAGLSHIIVYENQEVLNRLSGQQCWVTVWYTK